MEKPKCYGTLEYSRKSHICNNCEYKYLCASVKDKKPKNKRIKITPIDYL